MSKPRKRELTAFTEAVRLAATMLNEEPEAVEQRAMLLTEREIRAEIRIREEQIRKLTREADGYRLMLQGWRIAHGTEAESRQGENVIALAKGKPGLKEAILRVMGRDPNRVWTTQAIYEGLDTHDWLPAGQNQRQAIGATLSRMATTGEVVKLLGRGNYKLRATARDSERSKDGR